MDGVHDLHEHVRVQCEGRLLVTTEQNFNEGIVRLAQLGICADIIHRDGQRQLQRNVQRILQCRIFVQFEDAEAHVIPAEGRIQHLQRQRQSLVPLLVDGGIAAAGCGSCQQASAECAHHVAGGAEQENSVGTALVEVHAVGLVVAKLVKEPQHADDDVRLVEPKIGDLRKQRHMARVHDLKQLTVALSVVQARCDATQIAEHTNKRSAAIFASQILGRQRAQLV
mmetsp:Transcript_3626/g.10292  ORF Transcript_3626/g.10292 Transcript_3626/m.10292 type:complete len:225 (-) Transcript_3626:256-930(-)